MLTEEQKAKIEIAEIKRAIGRRQQKIEVEVLTELNFHGTTKKLRVKLNIDTSYDMQSDSGVYVWANNQWNFITSMHFNHMATVNRLKSSTNPDTLSKDEIHAINFDVNSLIDDAKAILF